MKDQRNESQIPYGSLAKAYLVSFDFSRGKGTEVCLVGTKSGKTLDVINAFEGQEAVNIYRMLMTKQADKQEKKPWLTAYDEIFCPYCNARFDEDIRYACRTDDFHWPRYCPDCGKEILVKQQEEVHE